MKLIDDGTLVGRRADLRRRHRALFPRAGRGHFGNAGDSASASATAGATSCKEQGAGQAAPHAAARGSEQSPCTLKPTDSQRIVRALEVLDASGRSILEWQAERGRPLIDTADARFLVIEPDRAELVGRIEARFDRCSTRARWRRSATDGASISIRTLPAMKAIGVRELQAAMAGQTWLSRGDRARQDRDPAICQAAGDLVPPPVGTGMAEIAPR